MIEADYEQIHLLPATLEDWVGPGHPARFIREFVKELDLKELGFKMTVKVAMELKLVGMVLQALIR